MAEAAQHRELVEFGLNEYRAGVVDALSFAVEDGQIPGIERASRRELVAFFRRQDPMEWTQLAQQDPEAAVQLFETWREAEGE